MYVFTSKSAIESEPEFEQPGFFRTNAEANDEPMDDESMDDTANKSLKHAKLLEKDRKSGIVEANKGCPDSVNGIINQHLNPSLPFRMNSQISKTSLLYIHPTTKT